MDSRKKIYCYDHLGYFTAESFAVESPAELGSGNYIMPANSTDIQPTFIEGKYTRFVNGEWTVEDQLQPTIEEAREYRNQLLRDSDWTQLPDAPSGRIAWAIYRDHLRDITNQPHFPNNIKWPVPPKR